MTRKEIEKTITHELKIIGIIPTLYLTCPKMPIIKPIMPKPIAI